MAKKDGMYLYNDWLAPFEKLEKAEVGELVIAMMKYFIRGEEPPRFQGLCGMAQDFIFPQIDRSMEYARLGSRGGIASKRKSVKNEIDTVVQKSDENEEVFDEDLFQKIAEENVSDEKISRSSHLKDEAHDCTGSAKKENGKVISDAKMFEKIKLEDGFNRFWRSYPKKNGRADAFKVFEKLSPDREMLKTIIDAVESQKKTKRWQKDGGQYIPYPSNWLEGRRWEDEIEEETSPFNSNTFDTNDFFEASLTRGKALQV